MTYPKIFFLATLGVILLMSFVTFVAFSADKRRAKKERERIKEKTLLAMTACFGAPGALLGRKAAHHKTEKGYFSLVIGFSLILQIALILYTAYLAFLR